MTSPLRPSTYKKNTHSHTMGYAFALLILCTQPCYSAPPSPITRLQQRFKTVVAKIKKKHGTKAAKVIAGIAAVAGVGTAWFFYKKMYKKDEGSTQQNQNPDPNNPEEAVTEPALSASVSSITFEETGLSEHPDSPVQTPPPAVPAPPKASSPVHTTTSSGNQEPSSSAVAPLTQPPTHLAVPGSGPTIEPKSPTLTPQAQKSFPSQVASSSTQPAAPPTSATSPAQTASSPTFATAPLAPAQPAPAASSSGSGLPLTKALQRPAQNLNTDPPAQILAGLPVGSPTASASTASPKSSQSGSPRRSSVGYSGSSGDEKARQRTTLTTQGTGSLTTQLPSSKTWTAGDFQARQAATQKGAPQTLAATYTWPSQQGPSHLPPSQPAMYPTTGRSAYMPSTDDTFPTASQAFSQKGGGKFGSDKSFLRSGGKHGQFGSQPWH